MGTMTYETAYGSRRLGRRRPKQGRKKGVPNLSESVGALVLTLRTDGHSYGDIAKMLGLKRSTVAKRCQLRAGTS